MMGVALVVIMRTRDTQLAMVEVTVSEGGGSQPAKFQMHCGDRGTVTLHISEDLNLSFSTVADDGKECVEYQVSCPLLNRAHRL